DGIRDFHVTGVQTCALPISVCGGAGPRAAGPRTGSARMKALFLALALANVLFFAWSRWHAPAVSGEIPETSTAPALELAGDTARSEERRVGKGRSGRGVRSV